MAEYIMAHDLGTSSHKCTIFNLEGEVAASSVYPYPTHYAEGGIAEQDPQLWWEAVVNTCKDVLQKIQAKDIMAVSFSAHMMGCLPLDRDGNPLRPSLIHADTRSEGLEKKWLPALDPDTLYQITGNRIDAHYPLLKVLWMQEEEPEIYRQAACFVQAKDYLVFRMTGQFGITDYSDASLTGMLHLHRREWDLDLLAEVSIDESKLPTPMSSTTIVGNVTKEASTVTGLLEGTPVVLGGGDGACATLGAGAVKEGDGYIYLGTTAWVSSVVAKPFLDPEKRVFTLCDLNPQYYNALGTMQTAGAAFQWAVEQFAALEMSEATSQGQDVYSLIEESLAKAPAGSQGLIFHPYLMGERSPIWNNAAKGTLFGLSLHHTRLDMLRSVMEGISYNLASIAEVLAETGRPARYLAIGGGMKSKVWRQILSDILQKPLVIPHQTEQATSLGAALAGGIGVGAYRDFEHASAVIQVAKDHQEPRTDAAVKDAYRKGLELYRKLYDDIEENYVF